MKTDEEFYLNQQLKQNEETKMKKVCSLFLALTLSIAGVSAVEAADNVVLRYANQHPVEHAATIAAQNAAAEIAEKTQGRVTIEIYPANQLGDWTQVYEEVMMGTIDMANTTVPETYDARIAAGMLPFLAQDYAELQIVMAPGSFLATTMEELQAEYGIQFLGYVCEGFSGIGTDGPVTDPAVIGADKGVLVRVPANDNFKFPTEHLGYRTSTIPYADTFAAIQTGVVDGWQAGPPNLNYLNFRDVITHYYHYSLGHEATQIYMNQDVFNGLSEEDQQIVREAFEKMWVQSAIDIEAEDAHYMQLLKDHGITVVEFSSEELSAMAASVREHVWPELARTYTQEFLDQLLQSIEQQ